ncbi:uncharacterized protein PGTG_22055 [Puccinia graminis f. sp. tritici CRL 75-36-700-3]|uniref:Uncharacterized protein n=1 Tax=Puccinia graminis f. sp. tritici (strain CRL 75-36-700-3 / race SCCL) TaxID=418459 RepID=H6QTI5_PUCGT|nr:uncharacterized protein PGTG_22055 [Puccinia graminis f. sp. tritici CRL 75-36-700-3]EHS64200.1 hypothetical protein PGTG_22055 [Puccinia graminis f. sp. tritici CRL 75-36-700-3]
MARFQCLQTSFRLRNEEFIRNYKPTDWELLSQEERLQIAITRIHREEDNTFAAKLLINETIRDYKEYKKQQRLIRMNPSTNASASNNLSTTVHTTTNTAAIDSIGNPEDTSVDELEDLLNYPRDRTSPDHSQLLLGQRVELPLEERVLQLSQLQIKKKTAGTADSLSTTDHLNNPDSQSKKRDEAMDLDDPLTSSEVTQKRQDSPEIITMTKKEKIRFLVKEHVAIWKNFEKEKASGVTNELKTIIHQAQESQKALQKLITKEELEGYVKGWNPWDAKRELFPPPPKKEGKKKSSTSRKAQQYDDPRVWADVFEIGQAWRAAYRQRSRKALPP